MARDISETTSRAIRITGQLEHDRLVRALQTIFNRHESLRTTFATNQLHSVRDSKPVQLIAASKTIEVPVFDLSQEPWTQHEGRIRELAQATVQRPFDLTLGPLLRTTVFRLGECDHVLLVNVHRIICDDSSLQILIHELWCAYQAYANEQTWSKTPLKIQYADYALRQRELFGKETISAYVDYWRQNLRGAPVLI